MPKIEFVKDDNTDRDYPDAFEITEAEFKIGDDYVCGEPCGGGGEHLLGDQHVYVELWGDDSTPVYPDPERIGCKADPFATIQRAFNYINSIVTIHGVIYLHIGKGEFFISEPIKIIHPNKIIIIGTDYPSDIITFSDNCDGKLVGLWFGTTLLFINSSSAVKIYMDIGGISTHFGDISIGLHAGGCSDGVTGIISCGLDYKTIDSITFASETNSTYFGDISLDRHQAENCSNGIIGLIGGGEYGSGNLFKQIDKFIIKISANSTDFGDFFVETSNTQSCGDNTHAFWVGGTIGIGVRTDEMLKAVFAIESNANYFGDLLVERTYGAAASNKTIGLIGNGNSSVSLDNIESLIMATDSFTTDFGDLTQKTYIAACSSSDHAMFGGGNIAGTSANKVNFSTKVVELNFGNITTGTSQITGIAGN